MKLGNLIWFVLAMPLVFTACKRDHSFGEDSPGNTYNITDPNKLQVPDGFNFVMTKDLTVRVKVAESAITFPGEPFRINIYLDEPSTGAVAVQTMTDKNYEASVNMRVPGFQEKIWIEKQDIYGNKEVKVVDAGKLISTLFSTDATSDYVVFKAGSGLNCSSSCGNTYNNYSGDLVITSGTNCITGTFSGKLTVGGNAIVKFCASGTLDSLNLNSNARVYILEHTIVTITKLQSNSSTSQFYNWSDSLMVSNCYDANNISENHGHMYINCSLNVQSTGDFGNFGKLRITNNLTVDNNFTNYDHVTVGNNCTVNATKTLYNYCNLSVTNNMTLDGKLTSNSYTKVVGTLTTGSASQIILQNGALLSVGHLTLNKTLTGTGTNTSYVKVGSTTTINSSGSITGKITYCDNNGVETNNGSMSSPAQFACSGYLATGSCNHEGFGVLVIPDADSDGVPDVLDEFPNDANRAFNRFYPCATTCSNIVFEDLWPAKGDYDYNDLVVAFNVHKVYSAGNKVVDYSTKIKPRAVGAGYDNAFGFSLDNVDASDVISTSGQLFTKNYLTINSNGTEAGQSKAVIICFDSPEPYLHRQGGSMFNTIKSNPFCESDTNFTSVTFRSPLVDSQVVFEEFNPFIIVNHNRGVEVHMANHKPTGLANVSLFGTSADHSVPSNGIYYKDGQGLPWAMQIPENFKYPIEKSSILQSYNYFDDWAMSGGTSYPNWYRNFGSYRNVDYIY